MVRGVLIPRPPVMLSAAKHLRSMAIIVLLVLIAFGCDDDSDAPRERGATTVKAAAPESYLEKPAAPVQQVIAPQAPKPTQKLAPDATCVTAECHASYATAKQIHGPVSEKSCNSCHENDIGGHRFPMKRAGNETCTFCHNVSGNLAHQHKPIADGGCVTCHDSHVSSTKFLLKADNVEQLCQKCHDVPLRRFAHEPFAKGQCTLCHEPHQSANAKFLRGGEGNDHCFTCHGPMKATLASAFSVHEPVTKSCGTCHDPHSSDFQHNLKTNIEQTCLGSCHTDLKNHIASAANKHDAVKTDQACANCHNAHASQQKHLLADRTDALCIKCHNKAMQTPDGRTIDNMVPVLTKSQFLHGPVRVGNCSACHDSHGGKNHSLLDAAFRVLRGTLAADGAAGGTAVVRPAGRGWGICL